jgi:hypothetical protein
LKFARQAIKAPQVIRFFAPPLRKWDCHIPQLKPCQFRRTSPRISNHAFQANLNEISALTALQRFNLDGTAVETSLANNCRKCPHQQVRRVNVIIKEMDVKPSKMEIKNSEYGRCKAGL